MVRLDRTSIERVMAISVGGLMEACPGQANRRAPSVALARASCQACCAHCSQVDFY
ncbi:hypothetical protein A2U01_0106323 [Trifolium medium]|uniref:Uncharacterized protein n=1 Tax=Trifolium medium TaxID=97028 RepID=A0A392V9T3_9FABA|nr:hypothetical protein [Trifolium medium]